MPKTEQVLPDGAAPVADVEALTLELAAPFEATEVKFKPGAISGNRALALPYVDARVIQDRLDDVLGVTGWQDEYECLPDGSVVCRLRLRLGEEWITKMDVGGPSEQPDEGDRRKAAFSDALKRAAVKFGLGRYLYRLPPLWVDYDTQRRQFVRPPAIPLVTLPRKAVLAARPEAVRPDEAPAAAKGRPAPLKGKKGQSALPADGKELAQRLTAYDGRLATQGLCKAGELIQQIVAAGARAGFAADLCTWSGPAIVLAVDETRAFEARCREKTREHKDVA